MSIVQNQNQFTMAPVVGQLSAEPNQNIKSARINPSSIATLITAGTTVKLIDGAANEILVDVCASITADAVYGVIKSNLKKNLYAAGDIVEIACEGSVIYLECSAAVARGTKVATTVSGPTVATDVTSTHQITGIALDKSTAAGVAIRVEVKPSVVP